MKTSRIAATVLTAGVLIGITAPAASAGVKWENKPKAAVSWDVMQASAPTGIIWDARRL